MSDNPVMAEETRTTPRGGNTGLRYEAEGKEFWYQLCVQYEAKESKYDNSMSTFLGHPDSGPQVKNENKYRMKMSRSYKQYKAGKLTAGMGQKKRSRHRKHVDIEEVLIHELQAHRMCKGGAQPRRTDVRKMAMRIANTLGKKDSFKASPVWLDSVLERMMSQSSCTCPSDLDHEDIESGSIPHVASPCNPPAPEVDVTAFHDVNIMAQKSTDIVKREKKLVMPEFKFASRSVESIRAPYQTHFDVEEKKIDQPYQHGQQLIEREALYGTWSKQEEGAGTVSLCDSFLESNSERSGAGGWGRLRNQMPLLKADENPVVPEPHPATQAIEPPQPKKYDKLNFKEGTTMEEAMNQSNKMAGSFAQTNSETFFPEISSLWRLDLETARLRNAVQDLQDARQFRCTQHDTSEMQDQLLDASSTTSCEAEDGRRGQPLGRVDHASIEHEALYGGWFKPEKTMTEETSTDSRHPADAVIDLPLRYPDRLLVGTVMTPEVPPPPPAPAENSSDEKRTLKRQYTAILKRLKAGIVHSKFASGEKMPSKLSLRSRMSENQKASETLPGLFREGQGSLGESRLGNVTVQPFQDLLRDQNELGYEPSPEEILPGAWRFDARETSEHLAPHPRLGHMLGFSPELHSSLSQYERHPNESGGFHDEEADITPVDVTVKVSRRQLPRWFLALLCALVLGAIAAIVVTLAFSQRSGVQLEGSHTIESAPSSSPSQDAPEWEQLGQVLRGAIKKDQLGRTLAISSGGSIVVASTRVITPSIIDTDYKDYIRVHQLNSDSQWVQLGDDFETADQAFVDLANNGTTLLIATVGREDASTPGSVKLFRWSPTTDGWNQLGDTIVAASEDLPSRYFGYGSKVSEDGSVVAVCDPGAGVVKAYAMLAGSWTQVGQTLVESSTTFSAERADGSTLSINSNGTVMAIGDSNNERKDPVGRVYAYQQGTSNWEQRGNVIERAMIDITSDWKNDRLSVSLSSDGNTVAVGNRYSYRRKGMVQALRYSENKWVRCGAMVIGKEAYKEFWSSMSLSADGSTFAAGTFRGGKSAVYYLTEAKEWEMVGDTIESLSGFREASYVALASDGMTVAIVGTRDETVTIFHLV